MSEMQPDNDHYHREAHTIAGWLLVTCLMVFILMFWGATVRLTGSGLSIPDWPLINGSLLPPFSADGWEAVIQDYQLEAERVGDPKIAPDVTIGQFRRMFWIEYMHRFLAAIVGIFFMVVAVKAYRSPAIKQRIGGHIVVLFFLLITQAVMGGIVVKSALVDIMISVHLIIALTFLAGLIWTALTVIRDNPAEGESLSGGLAPVVWSIVVFSVYLVQVWFGGMIAGGGIGRIINSWPKIFGRIVPPGELLLNPQLSGLLQNLLSNQVLIQFVHRWLAFLVLASFMALWIVTVNIELQKRTRFALRAVGGMLCLQILLGIFNVLFNAPTSISVVHSANAFATFAMLVVLVHDMRYGFKFVHTKEN